MSNFGISSISNRHCKVQGCGKLATVVVGNMRYRYNLKNLFLCDGHLKVLYEELNKTYGEPIKPTVDERTDEVDIKGQELLKDYIKLVYEANGMLSKAKLIEFCTENGIAVPEEANMKKIIECIFPELEELPEK